MLQSTVHTSVFVPLKSSITLEAWHTARHVDRLPHHLHAKELLTVTCCKHLRYWRTIGNVLILLPKHSDAPVHPLALHIRLVLSKRGNPIHVMLSA